MRWLAHGSISSAALEALKRHGHQARTPAEIEIPEGAGHADIFRAAHKSQLEVLTTDADLANALYEERTHFGRCIVFLNVEGGDVEQDDAIDRLFARFKRLTHGRLYTVTPAGVKVRQLPGDHGE